MNAGEYIKKHRQKKGLSQKKLGEKLGVSQQMIGQWENGNSNPKVETIQKIADALDITLDDLIPDSFEQKIQMGLELMIMDYTEIENMANHKIFTDEERNTIFKQIEYHRSILSKMDDIDKSEKYSEKTFAELENELFKMLINKQNFNTSKAIIILSCFSSLDDDEQESILQLLLRHCYPNIELKYF